MNHIFLKEIETLTMEPWMWKTLDESLPSDEYHKVVIDYQKREFEKLPKCKTLFGLCRSWAAGRCTRKCYCCNQVHCAF